jgi:hypothetical protein
MDMNRRVSKSVLVQAEPEAREVVQAITAVVEPVMPKGAETFEVLVERGDPEKRPVLVKVESQTMKLVLGDGNENEVTVIVSSNNPVPKEQLKNWQKEVAEFIERNIQTIVGKADISEPYVE